MMLEENKDLVKWFEMKKIYTYMKLKGKKWGKLCISQVMYAKL